MKENVRTDGDEKTEIQNQDLEKPDQGVFEVYRCFHCNQEVNCLGVREIHYQRCATLYWTDHEAF